MSRFLTIFTVAVLVVAIVLLGSNVIDCCARVPDESSVVWQAGLAGAGAGVMMLIITVMDSLMRRL